MFKVIKALHVKIPNDMRELRVLGQTLWKRRGDILAYFDTGRASNGGGLIPFRRSGRYASRPVARGGGQGDWSDHDEQ